MRIDIEIDEELLREAMRVSGAGSEKEVLEKGLRAVIGLKGQRAIRELRGKLRWEGDLEEMRRDR